MRTPLLWPVTAAVTGLWLLAAAAAVWWGFPAGPWAKAALLLAAVYGVGLVLYAGRAR
jgi:hypothetical protein